MRLLEKCALNHLVHTSSPKVCSSQVLISPELSTLRILPYFLRKQPSEYRVRKWALLYVERSHLLTSHLIDLQWHPASYLRSQFTSSSNFCTHKINNLHGAGLACVIVHRGGAAHVQYRLCARITERPPKILKIFTRNTESTVELCQPKSGTEGERQPHDQGQKAANCACFRPSFL